VALVCLLLGIGARLDGLNLAYTSDEGYWLQRTVAFGNAVLDGDWAATARSGHPGVTVMWVGLFGIGAEQARAYGGERSLNSGILEMQPGVERLMADARLEIAVISAGLFALATLLAGRLLGAPGLLGGLLLAADPYTVGMSRLLHVDALLTPLMLISALAGLIYWLDGRGWPFLLISAVSGGLALLTKAPAVALVPFFGIVWLVVARPWPFFWKDGWRRGARAWIAPLAWALLLVAVYVALWPTMWVRPIVTITAVARFVVTLGGSPHLWPTYFLGQPTTGDPGLLFYPVATLLRLGPVATIGLVLLAVQALRRRVSAGPGVLWLVVFAVVFVDMMAIGGKKFDRYMLPALAALTVLGGIGVSATAKELAERLRGRLADRDHRLVSSGVVALAIVAQGLWLLTSYPYPIAAYNPLAGGTAVARQALMVGWGEGLDQAAAYLNRLPGAERLTVSTQYHHVLRLAFDGRTVRVPSPRPVDYYVVYVNMIQRNTVPIPVRQAVADGHPVFTATVNGVPFAWVYRGPFTIATQRDVPGEVEDEQDDTPTN
jgi:4-amino-4-deoxy-L-arabinose transferase-like glycosyltransferase